MGAPFVFVLGGWITIGMLAEILRPVILLFSLIQSSLSNLFDSDNDVQEQ